MHWEKIIENWNEIKICTSTMVLKSVQGNGNKTRIQDPDESNSIFLSYVRLKMTSSRKRYHVIL